MQVAITTIIMRSLIAITSGVVRARKIVRSLPDRLSPGGVVRSGYETNVSPRGFTGSIYAHSYGQPILVRFSA